MSTSTDEFLNIMEQPIDPQKAVENACTSAKIAMRQVFHKSIENNRKVMISELIKVALERILAEGAGNRLDDCIDYLNNKIFEASYISPKVDDSDSGT